MMHLPISMPISSPLLFIALIGSRIPTESDDDETSISVRDFDISCGIIRVIMRGNMGFVSGEMLVDWEEFS